MGVSMARKSLILAVGIVTAAALSALSASAATLTPISTTLPAAIGVGYLQPTGDVVVSVNYPSGNPFALETVVVTGGGTGTQTQYSTLAGIQNEAKIAAVQLSLGGFAAGDIYFGNGSPGGIAKVASGGSPATASWVTLSPTSDRVSGITSDFTGVFGGDLLAATSDGKVWRVKSDGSFSLLTTVSGIFPEALLVVPNVPAEFGPWAGKLLVGGEGLSGVYVVDTTGATSFTALPSGVEPEDLDLVPSSGNLYAVRYGQAGGATSQLLTAPASDFTPCTILIAVEGANQLWDAQWNGTTFNTTKVWEDTTTEFELESATFSSFTCPSACPLTQGYWKNHPNAWPVTSLTIGGATYTQAQLLTILGTPPKQGNAVLILGHQLIAAELNIANGSDPSPILATILDADSLLSGISLLNGYVSASSALGQQMTADANLLDEYNSGLLTTCPDGD